MEARGKAGACQEEGEEPSSQEAEEQTENYCRPGGGMT